MTKQEEKNLPTEAQSTEVATQATQAYVTALFKKMQDEFLAVNADLDMDFVYMTTWLSIDSKGNFVEKSGDDVIENYKDEIDVVIAKGEQKFSLWGHEDSPEDGQLIVAEDTREEAEEVFKEWLELNPQAAERYDVSHIQSRYIAYIVPVASLTDETPKIYTLGMAPTSKMAYGQWGFNLFKGSYKAKGIPKGSGINQVVTKITTVSKTNKQKQNYIALQFDAVELFKPEKYLKK